jgi:hypothetical protein
MTEPIAVLNLNSSDPVTYRDIMQQRDEYRVKQNAMAQEQLKQQQNAILQTIYRRNVDASGNVNQQGIIRDMAQAGIPGIPGQMEALGKAGEASTKAQSERANFVLKAVGHALHTSVSNPTDEVLSQAKTTLAGVGLSPQEIDRELTPIMQLPLDQRKGALMQSILSDPNSKAAFEATLPKPAQMRLGDKVVTVDQNPLSPTFNQPIRTDMVGMTPKEAYDVSHPTLQHIQGADNGIYSFNTKTGGAAPVMVGGGGIPAGRGGADTVYGNGRYGAPPTPLSNMSVGQVQDYQRNSLIPATRGKVGAGADKGTGAVGMYQITYGTLQKYAPKVLGDNWRNTPFTAEVQDQLARAIYEDSKNGDLSKIWAGLPSNKPGAYSNVPWEQVRGQIARVESGGGRDGGGAAPAAGGGQLQGPTKGKPAAAASSSPAIQDIDAQISRLDELYNHKGLENITGSVHGRMGSLNALPGFDVWGYRIGGGGQEADNAQALLETIQANATLGELQKLKQSGTTLGQIAVYEDKMLGKAAANLKQTQDKATFQRALREYKQRLIEVKKLLIRASIPETAVKHLRDNPNLKNAFDSKYGAGMAASVLGGR